jgi:uncharacterized protein (DUF1800 family)
MKSWIVVASVAIAGMLVAATTNRSFEKPLTNDQKIAHVLNRLTFGPRPGDAAAVENLGLDKWIDAQLHPERITESPLVKAYLETLTTLNLSPHEVAEKFQPSGPASQGQGKQMANRMGPQAPLRELNEAKIYRAIFSERQLQEQLVDFWFNHFNVNIAKGADRFLTVAYERDTIRPHVLGKFRDLLGATARDPAMLFYLDNWQNSTPEPPGPLFAPRAKGKQQARGINENYARELLELHTLGVDNGYTQQDIVEVARCFTGWTILQPRQGGEFTFNPRMHDPGPKTVLGVKIPADGAQNDGERVLDILAKRPETAHFISLKLAQRFVADDPPPALVDRMAKKFRDTDGDLRAVVAAMIASPEFFSEGAWNAKVKTPLEFVVSAVRASGAEVRNAAPLAQKIADMGQPLYRKVEPTGYSTMAAEWVNSASLLARLNFAVDLAANRVPGSRVTTSDTGDASIGKTLGAPGFQKR